jgi:hypothetical protein
MAASKAPKTPTNAQLSNALARHYVKLHEAVHGTKPADFNLYRDRRGFEAMIEDLGYDRAKQVVEYYMGLIRAHPCGWLLYNYEKVNNRIIEIEEEQKNAAEVFEETRKRVEEWRRYRGKQGK